MRDPSFVDYAKRTPGQTIEPSETFHLESNSIWTAKVAYKHLIIPINLTVFEDLFPE